MSHRKYTYNDVKEIAAKYDTLAEFTKNHVGAYEAALHNGWLESFTHLKRKRVHTVESVLQECRKFDNYKDFINSDETIYGKFLKMYNKGEIKDEDLPWKVEKRKKEWTYDACYKEAKKYDSRWHFKLGCESAFTRAYINGWLDDYNWFKKRESKYTYEVCKELASHYNSRIEFQRECGGAYSQSSSKGWLSKFVFKEDKIKWTKEMILIECAKYKTKTNLFNNNKHAYDAYIRFKRKGLISDDEINWDIRIREQGDENARIHSVYAYVFEDNYVYVGRTMDPHKRDKQHRRPHHAHGRDNIGTVLKHSIESGIEIPPMTMLETDLNLQESCRQEDYWVNEYRNKGYNILNKGVTGEFVGSIGGFKQKWTKEMVIEYAKKFDKLADLYRNCSSMKHLLERFNLLDELFPNRLRAHKITFEEAKEAASHYKTRTRFQKGSRRYYDASRKNGWLDILFPKNEE